ncbi:MAG: transglycosylase SLT domain-containing protein [Gammaproteobacteria bacterium]
MVLLDSTTVRPVGKCGVDLLSRQGMASMMASISVKHMLISMALAWGMHALPAWTSVINEDEGAASSSLSGDAIRGEEGESEPQTAVDQALPEAVYYRIDRQMQQAWHQHVRAVRAHWQDASVSSAMEWVTYVDGMRIRRCVDFRNNQIDITVPAVHSETGHGVDYSATGERVEQQLRALLSTTIEQALMADPVFENVWPELQQYAPITFSKELVLSELFSESKPSDRAVARLSQRLMAKAEVGFYQKVANGSVNMSVKLDERLTYTVPLPSDRLIRKARQYRGLIVSSTEAFHVPTDLVYAIIHTESHFNPLARSPVPAYGLMQIVPSTSGRDASRVLFDHARLLSPSFLYDPQNNIKVGAAYIRLLYFNYFKAVQDPKSRLYCVIAAYNAGITAVARVFGDATAVDRVAPALNALSSQQVLARLLESLPAQETRDYLKKVLARKSLYSRV